MIEESGQGRGFERGWRQMDQRLPRRGYVEVIESIGDVEP